MARESFEDWNPSDRNLSLIQIANDICREMKEQGYDLTLRQLYYQFVARGYIENTDRSYKNLGGTLNKARMAGLMDWDYLEDRTRNLAGFTHADGVPQFVASQRPRFHVDRWQDQPVRAEVWVEKEALVSVVGQAALSLDVDYFACRGYVSQSEMYAAAQRHLEYEYLNQRVVIIHLGDHDPSGMDMTDDITGRMETFGTSTEVRRIALNRDQIDRYGPPPNPAKITDSRAKRYIAQHGRSSWELDALTPAVLDAMVKAEIMDVLEDEDAWNDRAAEEATGKELLGLVSRHWPAVAEYVEGL